MKLKFWKKEKKELTEYEKLSESIADGILLAIGKLCCIFGAVFLMIMLVYGGLYTYVNYSENNCFEEGICPETAEIMQPAIDCKYPRITCLLFGEYEEIPSEGLGGGGSAPLLKEQELCGWQEAEAWKSYIKEYDENYENLSVICYEN